MYASLIVSVNDILITRNDQGISQLKQHCQITLRPKPWEITEKKIRLNMQEENSS